jgi:hypothetical protein
MASMMSLDSARNDLLAEAEVWERLAEPQNRATDLSQPSSRGAASNRSKSSGKTTKKLRRA